MVCESFKRIKYFTRVGVNMRAYNRTIVTPIELQFTEAFDHYCGVSPLQFTEGFEDRCYDGNLEHEEGWEY